MGIYTIYRATNLLNNKNYIGFDSHWPKRKLEHKSAAKRDISYNKFYNAIKKYGWENFEWEIVYQSKDGHHCLNEMEPFFITKFNSLAAGYNSSFGGESGLGNKWWNNGKCQVFTPYPPDDTFIRGSLPFNNVGAKIGSDVQKQKRWINNGIHEMMYRKGKELPANYVHGRLPSKKLGKPNLSALGTVWWNDGNVNKMSKDCPGKNFIKGRLNFLPKNNHSQHVAP